MAYKLTNNTLIIRFSDGAQIPANPENTDYAAYLAWIDAGNTPESADTPPQLVEPTFAELRMVEENNYIELRKKMCARVDGISNRFARAALPFREQEKIALLAEQTLLAEEQAALALEPPDETIATAKHAEALLAADTASQAAATATIYEAGALSCDTVINGLLEVLKHSSVTGAATIPALKQALKIRYLTAVSAATPVVLVEFKRYDK